MTTASKPRAPRKTPARKPAPKPTPDSADEAVQDAPLSEAADAPPALLDLKKAELVDLVVARSGVKKRDAKPAVEATLAVLGQALAEGRPLNLAPLGKAKHLTVKDKDNARVINMRLRQPKQAEISDPTPLDPSAE